MRVKYFDTAGKNSFSFHSFYKANLSTMSSPRLITVLTVFCTLLTFARCQLSLEIDRTSIIYFSRESFQKFIECLCDNDIRKCSATVDKENSDDKHLYSVTNTVDSLETFDPDWYSHSYSCFWYSITATEIVYRRLTKKDLNKQTASDNICQVLFLNNLPSSCSLKDVFILWSKNQDITEAYPVTKDEDRSFCEPQIPTARTTTTTTSTSTFDSQKGDNASDSDDNIPLIVGVVVVFIVVLVIAGIIIIWWRRKRNSKPPSTSHHYTTSTGVISQNLEEKRHEQEHISGNGRSVTNSYATANNESLKAKRLGLQSGQAVVDSYISPDNTIQKKMTAADQSEDKDNHTTEYTSIDEDIVSPETGPYNTYKDNGHSYASSSANPASTTYSRLGEHVRIIQNPYDALQNPDEYSVVKFTPTNSNTSAHYSFAGQETNQQSTQDSETVHYSTPSSQPTNRNTYDYEVVGVNKMITSPDVSFNHYEEAPNQACGGNEYGDETSPESDYTKFSVGESEPAKNEYAKLGDPVRNIQNPYDVMAN